MTELAKRVEDFAARCRPDKIYTNEGIDEAVFSEFSLADILNDPSLPPTVNLLLNDGDRPVAHVLNPWSRSQLLSIVGTKEKWFTTVTRAQEADELNLRRAALFQHRFRTMDTEIPDLRILRGIISSFYGDIPDTDVMKALMEVMPDSYAIRHLSAKTDKALYAYALKDQFIGIPGTLFSGFPGIAVKNSEVGFTSLWVIPILYIPPLRQVLVFEKKVLLRRTHRGTISEMKEKFEEALQKAAVVWSDTVARASHLASIVFPSEDVAVSRMRSLIVECGGTKHLAHRAEQRYRSQSFVVHNGSTVLTAIVDVVEKSDADDAYVEAAVAGAVLWNLST